MYIPLPLEDSTCPHENIWIPYWSCGQYNQLIVEQQQFNQSLNSWAVVLGRGEIESANVQMSKINARPVRCYNSLLPSSVQYSKLLSAWCPAFGPLWVSSGLEKIRSTTQKLSTDAFFVILTCLKLLTASLPGMLFWALYSVLLLTITGIIMHLRLPNILNTCKTLPLSERPLHLT